MDSAFVDVVNRFGFQLQTLTLDPDKPTGICAMNIFHCLSMVAAGSKDKNLAAFSKAMGFDVGALDETLQRTVKLDTYSKTNPAVEFNTGSSIWHAGNFILEKPWLETVQKTFGATVGLLELQPINDFIFCETRGKFKDLIKPQDLVGAVFMLVTTLYFKAQWENPFDKLRTAKNSEFHTFDGKTQVCSMMSKVDRMEYVEDREIQACFLPYRSEGKGPQWKAAVILPQKPGLDAVQTILAKFSKSPEILAQLLIGSHAGEGTASSRPTSVSQSRTTKVSFSMPCFSLKLHLNLIPALESLGLEPVFQPSGDFAPISTGPLMINRVTHDLFLEVNEEGTEMAAVTVVSMRQV